MKAVDFGILGLVFVLLNQLCGAPINGVITLWFCLVSETICFTMYPTTDLMKLCLVGKGIVFAISKISLKNEH